MPMFLPAALAFFRVNSDGITLFTLKKARAAVQNVDIHCLFEVGTRESVLNMQEPTEKLPLQSYLHECYSGSTQKLVQEHESSFSCLWCVVYVFKSVTIKCSYHQVVVCITH